MNTFRIYRAALPVVMVALLATVCLLLNAPNRQVIASGRSLSHLPPDGDLQQFEGCWKSGGYSLYIAVIGDELKGKIRCNCGDPQKIYDVKVEENTITGRWDSDPEFKRGDEKGTKRRGTFMMTLKGSVLDGVAHEGDDSEEVGFRGRDWPWNWTRQTDTKMCDDTK